jgi:cell division protein FtsI/penicillin-binding protein 2
MKTKFWMIRIAFMAAFVGLIVNAYSIQIRKGDYYTKKAQAQQEATGQLNPNRGVIYFTDKNGNDIPVVLNKEYPTVYAVPKEIENPKDASVKLAYVLGKDYDGVLHSLSKPNDLYELLSEKATKEQVEKIRELNIKGIYVRNETFRYYPFKGMASHVLGYISSSEDGRVGGRYGVELQFDEKLRGTAGIALDDSSGKPQNGTDLRLTLDRNIQTEGEKIIAELMDAWHAESASFLVQDPSTGKILAMANLPDFDPNEYAKSSVGHFKNDSLQSVYEPGSVFKIVTMSAGIDSGKITPDTTYVDSGSVTLNGRTMRNWDHKAHGLQTMTNVIEQSLNTGTIFAEQHTGHAIFYDYVKKFGFGEKTGVSLPGEVKGSLANLENGREVNYATGSFGQGLSVTPLQMISAVSTIANGGLLMKPIILQSEKPEVVRRVISKETADKVTAMMVSAVDKNILAHVNQYNVAGKTGTAFIPDFKNGGYSDNVINTYVGYAPASNPRFVILIKLVKPSNAPLAGQTVVPAFKRLTQYLLNYYEIAPDRQAAPAGSAQQ